MFLSTYTNKVDVKGRVSIPSKYRNVLGKDLAVICWPSLNYPAIDVCGMDFLNKVSESIDEFPLFSVDREKLSCAIMANMHELNVDQNGRIIIPLSLSKYADIGSSVTFIGQGSKFQIWNPGNAKDFIEDSLARSKSFNFFNKKGDL